MAAAETRARVLEKLQEEMDNRKAIELNQQEKLDKQQEKLVALSEMMEVNQSQTSQNISAVDRKLGAAVEMLSQQINQAMGRTENYNRDKSILGSFPTGEQQFHPGKFVPSSSQTPLSPLPSMDSKQPRYRADDDNS